MGIYQLKNIERPVEVFALSHEGLYVPLPYTLKGKTEEIKTLAPQPQPKKLRLNQKSIAVLPFRAISSDSNIDWLSDGFTEELTSAIAGISNLRVKSSTTMMQYKNERKSIEKISEELHVANFIEGTVQKEGDNILINARLINPKTGEIRRPFKFRKDFSEIQFIYSQVAQEVAENLNVMLKSREKQKLQQTGRVNPEAYQLALQGFYLSKKFTHRDISKAMALFNEALQMEPDYALALTGIAYCHVIMGIWNPVIAPAEALNKSLPLLEKALKKNPSLALAHSTLGWARMFFKWDLVNAEK
jgi:TolB-like protein